MAYNSFEEMPVWQKALKLAVAVFKLTDKLPRKEDYGLTSQIRRSALSIPGNPSDHHSTVIEEIWKELNSLR
jgi:hypothetical protein